MGDAVVSDTGELSKQEVERHKLPSNGRWFWRLRGCGDDAASSGLEEFTAGHPTDAPAATWDNVRNKNAGSKIFGWFSGRDEYASALLEPSEKTVPCGYELIRKGMDVKAFADFDAKFAVDGSATEPELHERAKEQFRGYLVSLKERCEKWIGIQPIMYVSDSCRLVPGGHSYKASFHVTITNVVFSNVDLRDNWMHSLFSIAKASLKPDPSVYNSDVRSMRAVGNAKKTSPDVKLTMDYGLSSAECVQTSLLPTLITYLEGCPQRVTLVVQKSGICNYPNFHNVFLKRPNGKKRTRAGGGESGQASNGCGRCHSPLSTIRP